MYGRTWCGGRTLYRNVATGASGNALTRRATESRAGGAAQGGSSAAPPVGVQCLTVVRTRLHVDR